MLTGRERPWEIEGGVHWYIHFKNICILIKRVPSPCLSFSRGNWVTGSVYPGREESVCICLPWEHIPGRYCHHHHHPPTPQPPPSLWERELLKVEQNMSAVVASSDLPLPRKEVSIFKRRRPASLRWTGRENDTEGQKQVAQCLSTLEPGWSVDKQSQHSCTHEWCHWCLFLAV